MSEEWRREVGLRTLGTLGCKSFYLGLLQRCPFKLVHSQSVVYIYWWDIMVLELGSDFPCRVW